MSFDRFIGIDWSGAKTTGGGIQVAECELGDSAPRLVRPKKGTHWKRPDLLQRIADDYGDSSTLIGFDFSFAFPYVGEDSYFPLADKQPTSPADLWRLVEEACSHNNVYYAGSFCEAEPWRDHFFRGKDDVGNKFRPRLRRVEEYCRAQKLGVPESVYKLAGLKQVGKGSLSGMRFLLALKSRLPNLSIWPFEKRSERAGTVVEVFPRLFLAMAGYKNRKITTKDELNKALKTLGSAPMPDVFCLHAKRAGDQVDALITSAGLRRIHNREELWCPPEMKTEIRRTEGWIFGVA